jgi:hypothetical protein
MTTTNKRYSYLRVTMIRIDIHPTGENPINMTRTLWRQSMYVWHTLPSSSPVCGNLSRVVDRFGWIPLVPQKGLLTQSTAHRLTDPWVRIQFLSQANQWSSRLKPSFCWWQATRLTRPISPACDRYIQYLLMGVNPSIINRHRQGIQHWRHQLSTHHSPAFHLRALTGL